MRRMLVAAAIAGMTCVAFAAGDRAEAAKEPVVRACFPVQALQGAMVDWWPGDESAADLVGYRTGILRGNARIAPGLVSGAFAFDGDGDFVEVPDDSMLDFGEQDFTVLLWVKFNSTAGEQVLIEKWVQKYTSISTGWTLLKADDQSIGLAVSTAESDEIDTQSETLDIPVNVWMHVAARREHNELSLFFNGKRVAVTLADPMVPLDVRSTSTLKIGHRGTPADTPGSEEDGPGFFVNGQIDEVQLFAGRALPPGLIRAIYLAGHSGVCKP